MPDLDFPFCVTPMKVHAEVVSCKLSDFSALAPPLERFFFARSVWPLFGRRSRIQPNAASANSRAYARTSSGQGAFAASKRLRSPA